MATVGLVGRAGGYSQNANSNTDDFSSRILLDLGCELCLESGEYNWASVWKHSELLESRVCCTTLSLSIRLIHPLSNVKFELPSPYSSIRPELPSFK